MNLVFSITLIGVTVTPHGPAKCPYCIGWRIITCDITVRKHGQPGWCSHAVLAKTTYYWYGHLWSTACPRRDYWNFDRGSTQQTATTQQKVVGVFLFEKIHTNYDIKAVSNWARVRTGRTAVLYVRIHIYDTILSDILGIFVLLAWCISVQQYS